MKVYSYVLQVCDWIARRQKMPEDDSAPWREMLQTEVKNRFTATEPTLQLNLLSVTSCKLSL